MPTGSYTPLAARAAVRGNLADRLRDLERRVRALERSHPGRPGILAGNVAYYDEDGALDVSAGGVRMLLSTANVSDPPTDAQLDAEFGTPDAVGPGFHAVIDDDGAGAHFWAVWSDGTNWWYEECAKAV